MLKASFTLKHREDPGNAEVLFLLRSCQSWSPKQPASVHSFRETALSDLINTLKEQGTRNQGTEPDFCLASQRLR
jgi:hypothetical protein